MKGKLLLASLLGLTLLGVCGNALAHHGNAAYDDKITEFKNATITKFGWANPHALINFDAKDAKGKLVHVVVETPLRRPCALLAGRRVLFRPATL